MDADPMLSRLEAKVTAVRKAMDRSRAAALAADKGKSVGTIPPCPLPDNKAGFRRYVDECWTGKHQPCPDGWDEFVAYLDSVRAWSAAQHELAIALRRKAREL